MKKNVTFSFVINFNIFPAFISTISKKDKNYLFIKNKKSYYLAKKNNLDKFCRIYHLSENNLVQFFFLLVLLIYSKFKKYKVNFYHKSYWPIFDLLLNFFKVNSTRYEFLYQDFSGKNIYNQKIKNIL